MPNFCSDSDTQDSRAVEIEAMNVYGIIHEVQKIQLKFIFIDRSNQLVNTKILFDSAINRNISLSEDTVLE